MPPHRLTARLTMAVVVATVFAFAAACATPGPDATPPPAPGPTSAPAEETVAPVLEGDRMDPYIVDQGFTAREDPAAGQRISFAAVLRNPNEASWTVAQAVVTATFTDAAGGVVYSAHSPVHTLLPGTDAAVVASTAAGDTARPTGRPTAMSLRVEGVQWAGASSPQGEVTFTAGSPRPDGAGPDGAANLLVDCDAQSSLPGDLRGGSIDVVYRDDGGTIVGGSGFGALADGTAPVIRARATTPLPLRDPSPPPRVATVDCYYGPDGPR